MPRLDGEVFRFGTAMGLISSSLRQAFADAARRGRAKAVASRGL
jgi:hypothetical protein